MCVEGHCGDINNIMCRYKRSDHNTAACARPSLGYCNSEPGLFSSIPFCISRAFFIFLWWQTYFAALARWRAAWTAWNEVLTVCFIIVSQNQMLYSCVGPLSKGCTQMGEAVQGFAARQAPIYFPSLLTLNVWATSRENLSLICCYCVRQQARGLIIHVWFRAFKCRVTSKNPWSYCETKAASSFPLHFGFIAETWFQVN